MGIEPFDGIDFVVPGRVRVDAHVVDHCGSVVGYGSQKGVSEIIFFMSF